MSSGLTIYNAHFGLAERPFTLLPDPDFLYWSDNHARAYSMLEYGMLTHAPITVITGEIGAGKTTLLRHLLRSLPGDVTVGLVSNAQGDRGELLHWVLTALDVDVEPGASYVQLFRRFQDYLIAQYAAGRRELASGVPEQRVDQCVFTRARTGMHDHARRLVHDDQVRVFEEDFQRDVLRRHRRRRGSRHVELHRVARAQDRFFVERPPRQRHATVVERRLPTRPADLGKTQGEYLVGAFGILAGRHGEA